MFDLFRALITSYIYISPKPMYNRYTFILFNIITHILHITYHSITIYDGTTRLHIDWSHDLAKFNNINIIYAHLHFARAKYSLNLVFLCLWNFASPNKITKLKMRCICSYTFIFIINYFKGCFITLTAIPNWLIYENI